MDNVARSRVRFAVWNINTVATTLIAAVAIPNAFAAIFSERMAQRSLRRRCLFSVEKANLPASGMVAPLGAVAVSMETSD
jgi:hypothetical protein